MLKGGSDNLVGAVENRNGGVFFLSVTETNLLDGTSEDWDLFTFEDGNGRQPDAVSMAIEISPIPASGSRSYGAGWKYGVRDFFSYVRGLFTESNTASNKSEVITTFNQQVINRDLKSFNLSFQMNANFTLSSSANSFIYGGTSGPPVDFGFRIPKVITTFDYSFSFGE